MKSLVCVCSLAGTNACYRCGRYIEVFGDVPNWKRSPEPDGYDYIPIKLIPDPCHGCKGLGWVPVEGKALICPICHGKGEKVKEPDPSKPPSIF